jgi:predicted Zn-ribbon and HTH transcriptional regulator
MNRNNSQEFLTRQKRSWELIQKLFQLLIQNTELLEKTKTHRVIDKQQDFNVYNEFKELKQTLDKVKNKLAPFHKEDCPITEPSLLNSMNIRMEKIISYLMELEPEISFVFLTQIKIKIYSAEFVVYQELEHILAMFDANLKKPIDIFPEGEAKIMWSIVFGDEVSIAEESFPLLNLH